MNITDQEKQQLKNKISRSVSNHVKRRKYGRYGAVMAAIFILGFIIVTKFENAEDHSSPIETYVDTSNDQKLDHQVRLILNNNQNVEIRNSESTISYSTTGEKISIGNSTSISQTTSKEKEEVFNTLIVPFGKRSSIVLSDGTKVWLNSGSKLVFPATFIQNTREVYLDGEGIFEVTHDTSHPFIVKSGAQDIEVLGTVFNVSNYHDDEAISTVLKSGSVKINYKSANAKNSQESLTIVPNTLALYNRDNGQIRTKSVEVDTYFSWRDGIFIFKNDSMKSIMKKVSRYYNIEIIIKDEALSNTTFSGSLDVKENVENVIKIIQETTTFDYKITNNKLIIN